MASALAELVEMGSRAWQKLGRLPDGFFSAGNTTASDSDYLDVLAAWTQAVSETLTPGERDLFWLLCCLEEPDRVRPVRNTIWPHLWRQLGRAGEPPDVGRALAAAAASGLAAVRQQIDGVAQWYVVHPGVADAGRAHAGTRFREAVDTEAIAFWTYIYDRASWEAGAGTVNTGLLVRAGLSAAPYLVRLKQWRRAAFLLERAFMWDPSRANAAAVLPAITQVTRHDPSLAGVLAPVLQVLDPAAETVMRNALEAAVTADDYTAAAAIAGRLMHRCLEGGQLSEALTLAQRAVGYSRQAGLGPWSQLSAECGRLQVLNAMGQASHVLAEVTRLRDQLAALPAVPGPDEVIPRWNVREVLADTGHHAAVQLGRWADALDFNAARVASLDARNAPAAVTAAARFNDYGPLLRLGRLDEVIALLRGCLRVFQDAHDSKMLGMTLHALAHVENLRGHSEAALHFERDALRYSYLGGDVAAITASYHNLGYFLRHAHRPAQALASHLAAALIRALANLGRTHNSIQEAAADLHELGTAAVPKLTVVDMNRQLGDIPGTDLPSLIEGLSRDPAIAGRTLQDLIAQACVLAAGSPEAPTNNPPDGDVGPDE